MTVGECMKQLESLKKHCEDFTLEDNDEFNKDAKALDFAIKCLKRTIFLDDTVSA
jgi:hypothetical protein